MNDVAPDNEAQQQYWNEPGGRTWTAWQERMDRQLAPFGEAVLDALAPQPGERVLDIGCGCGHTTLDVAGRVAPNGAAVGLDISTPMIERARERAASSPNAGTRFVVGDAQVLAGDALGGPFDAVMSRFGVMFFGDPVAAFANLRACTRAGGRLAFVCWQAPGKNLWMSSLGRELASLFPDLLPVDPNAPGPFAFADPVRIGSILAEAGWSNAAIEPCVRTMQLFGTDDFDTAVEGSLSLGAASRLLVGASPEQHDAARDVAERVMRGFWGEGGALLDGVCWLVTARRPG